LWTLLFKLQRKRNNLDWFSGFGEEMIININLQEIIIIFFMIAFYLIVKNNENIAFINTIRKVVKRWGMDVQLVRYVLQIINL